MKPMPPPPPVRKKRSTISNPVGRKVAGAEGRASEFYSGPQPKSTRRGSFGKPKTENGIGRSISNIAKKKTPVKRGGR